MGSNPTATAKIPPTIRGRGDHFMPWPAARSGPQRRGQREIDRGGDPPGSTDRRRRCARRAGAELVGGVGGRSVREGRAVPAGTGRRAEASGPDVSHPRQLHRRQICARLSASAPRRVLGDRGDHAEIRQATTWRRWSAAWTSPWPSLRTSSCGTAMTGARTSRRWASRSRSPRWASLGVVDGPSAGAAAEATCRC